MDPDYVKTLPWIYFVCVSNYCFTVINDFVSSSQKQYFEDFEALVIKDDITMKMKTMGCIVKSL